MEGPSSKLPDSLQEHGPAVREQWWSGSGADCGWCGIRTRAIFTFVAGGPENEGWRASRDAPRRSASLGSTSIRARWRGRGSGTVRRASPAGRGQSFGRSNGGQRSRSLEARRFARTPSCAAQGLLRLAQSSEMDHSLGTPPAEPQYTDPYVRWSGRGGAVASPYPDRHLGVLSARP